MSFPVVHVSRSRIKDKPWIHYIDVIMTTMASQITSLTVVYSAVYSDADQRKHQSSASLAFVWGIHRDRWIPRTKGQLHGKCFHLMTSSCTKGLKQNEKQLQVFIENNLHWYTCKHVHHISSFYYGMWRTYSFVCKRWFGTIWCNANKIAGNAATPTCS